MKIFISWSGSRSNLIAIALKTWIENVFQNVEAFISQSDIEPGSRWAERLNEELKLSNYGIVCLTPENLHADWILFEAGALSKQVNSRLTPLLFELKEGDVSTPLSQFQCLVANEEGVKKLVKSINKSLERPLSPEKLDSAFDVWRGKILADIKAIPIEYTKPLPAPRPERELIEEILQYIRGQVLTKTMFKKIIGTTEDQLKNMPKNEVLTFIQDCLETPKDIMSPLEVNPIYKKGYLATSIAKTKFPEFEIMLDNILKTLAPWKTNETQETPPKV